MDHFSYLPHPDPDPHMIDIGVPEPLPDDHELPPGVRVQVLKNLDPELDISEVDGIRCTTVERTLVDLSDEWSPLEIAAVIERAHRMGMFDVERFQETSRRVQHERGSWVAARALELWRAGNVS